MSLQNRKKKLKNLLSKLFKAGIDLSDVTDKGEEQLLHPKALEKFSKLVKRALERPKIVEESKNITQKMKERVAAAKEHKKAKQEAKNADFLEKHPQFNQVFKYDVNHNKSGDAEATAKSYMKSRKQRLIKELNESFNFSKLFKEKLKADIMDNDFSIDLINAMESISENLIYKKDSGGDDAEMDFGEFDSPDDEFANRLLNRYYRARKFYENEK